jgi:hypothetical protein
VTFAPTSGERAVAQWVVSQVHEEVRATLTLRIINGHTRGWGAIRPFTPHMVQVAERAIVDALGSLLGDLQEDP